MPRRRVRWWETPLLYPLWALLALAGCLGILGVPIWVALLAGASAGQAMAVEVLSYTALITLLCLGWIGEELVGW